MEADKVRNLSDTELAQAQRDQMDQLFRLKFQMKMGQTESLNKIRSLRRGVARMKTIARERQLGIDGPHAPKTAQGSAKAEGKAEAKHAVKAASKSKSKSKAKAKPAKKAAKKSAKKSGKR